MREFLLRNYLDEDLCSAAERYASSEECRDLCGKLEERVSAGSLVCDLGCGRGVTSFAVARRGFRVVSVEEDDSESVGLRALAHAGWRLAVRPLPIQGDALALPFVDCAFDVVLCRSVLHHLTNLEQGMREIYRVLKPGGWLFVCNEHIISVFSTGRRFLRAHPATAYGVEERAYPAWRYWKHLRRAGFRRLSFFRHPLDFPGFRAAMQHNPLRARLIALPGVGRLIVRLLYLVYVIRRAYLCVDERGLAAVSMFSQRPSHPAT